MLKCGECDHKQNDQLRGENAFPLFLSLSLSLYNPSDETLPVKITPVNHLPSK